MGFYQQPNGTTCLKFAAFGMIWAEQLLHLVSTVHPHFLDPECWQAALIPQNDDKSTPSQGNTY